MSLTVQIRVESKGAEAAAGSMETGLQGSQLVKVGTRAVQNRIRSHFQERNRERPNRLGGRRTNFFLRAAGLANFRLTEGTDSGRVGIVYRGLRQRLLGGKIRPRTAKVLAIPVVAEAHGKRPSDFGDRLEVVFVGKRPIGLAYKEAPALPSRKGRVGKTRSGMVFIFKKSVTQKADPSVLPTVAAMQEDVARNLTSFLARRTRRGGGTAPAGGPSA
jgi:hypothetical protein